MNMNNPEPCGFQENCHNFCPAKNGNCAAEFDDVLDCWVELESGEKSRYSCVEKVAEVKK